MSTGKRSRIYSGGEMKDPKRIDKIIELLRATWKSTPTERLGQLIVNVIRTAELSRGRRFTSLFYVEDEDLTDALKDYFKPQPTENK